METAIFAAVYSIRAASQNQSTVRTGGQSADALEILEVAHGQSAGHIRTAPAGCRDFLGRIEKEHSCMVGGCQNLIAGKSQSEATAAFPIGIEMRKLALSRVQLAPPASFAGFESRGGNTAPEKATVAILLRLQHADVFPF